MVLYVRLRTFLAPNLTTGGEPQGYGVYVPIYSEIHDFRVYRDVYTAVFFYSFRLNLRKNFRPSGEIGPPEKISPFGRKILENQL